MHMIIFFSRFELSGQELNFDYIFIHSSEHNTSNILNAL